MCFRSLSAGLIMLKINKFESILSNIQQEMLILDKLGQTSSGSFALDLLHTSCKLAKLERLLAKSVKTNSGVFFLKFREVEETVNALYRLNSDVDPQGFLRSTSQLEHQNYLEALCNEYDEDNFVASCAIKLMNLCFKTDYNPCTKEIKVMETCLACIGK